MVINFTPALVSGVSIITLHAESTKTTINVDSRLFGQTKNIRKQPDCKPFAEPNIKT